MGGLTVTCRVAVGSQSKSLDFLHLKTADQNAPVEAELLDLTSIP